MEALNKANALRKEGKDLSSMPLRARQVVQIAPLTRFVRTVVTLNGVKERIPVIGRDGTALVEVNPVGGKVGLTQRVVYYVQTVIDGLKSSAAEGTLSNPEAALLKGYEGVLSAHRASMAVEKVNWITFEQEMGRVLTGTGQAGDERYLKPIYAVLAKEAADSGNQDARSYLLYRDEYERRQEALELVRSPTRKVME
jgi:hypothetical protein